MDEENKQEEVNEKITMKKAEKQESEYLNNVKKITDLEKTITF